jgi:hypothetical protein
MLAEEYDVNFLSLLNKSCLQAEEFQTPALNKHKQRCVLFMKTAQVIIEDPFVDVKPIAELIATQYELMYINVRLLLDELLIQDMEVLNKLNAGLGVDRLVFKNLITKQLELNKRKGAIFSLDPHFPSNKSDWQFFLSMLQQYNFKLSCVWYIKNSNIANTVEESMTMKGYPKPFNKKIFSAVLNHAVENQRQTLEFIEEINVKDLISTLETNTMQKVPQEVVSKVKEVFKQA